MKLQRSTIQSSLKSQAKKQPAFKDTVKKILKKTSKIFQKKPKEEQKQTTETDVKDVPVVQEASPMKRRCPMRRKKRDENSPMPKDENVMLKKTKNSWTKQQSGSSSSQGEAQIAFFCSNDKYFNSCDDSEMIEMIQAKYPSFMRYGTDDNEIKRTLILLFQDKPFVDEFLQFYNITIQDFFKFIFRNEMSVFKGPYISKVSKILKDVGYDV